MLLTFYFYVKLTKYDQAIDHKRCSIALHGNRKDQDVQAAGFHDACAY